MTTRLTIASTVFVFLTFLASCKKDSDAPVTDIDGNVYTSVTIGTQTWMKENLRTTRFNDGVSIPLISGSVEWTGLVTPGYCWYNNDTPSGKKDYGALYNWFTVNTGKLCPSGWHVPSDTEWKTLTDYLGGVSAAGGKLKESGTLHWNAPNSDATNESGFTALPGGYRSYRDGIYFSLGDNASWWSSSPNTASAAWSRAITLYTTTDVLAVSNEKRYGVSVRCLKNQE